MKLPHNARAPRPGYTLIELLMVIGIIALLVSLTAAGVFKYIQEGPKVQARSDISQISTSLGLFHTKFGFYPPDHFTIEKGAINTWTGESKDYLLKMYPRLDTNKTVVWT